MYIPVEPRNELSGQKSLSLFAHQYVSETIMLVLGGQRGVSARLIERSRRKIKSRPVGGFFYPPPIQAAIQYLLVSSLRCLSSGVFGHISSLSSGVSCSVGSSRSACCTCRGSHFNSRGGHRGGCSGGLRSHGSNSRRRITHRRHSSFFFLATGAQSQCTNQRGQQNRCFHTYPQVLESNKLPEIGGTLRKSLSPSAYYKTDTCNKGNTLASPLQAADYRHINQGVPQCRPHFG